MSKRDWKLYCEDVLDSIGLIEQYTKGMTFEQFIKDRKTIDAVVRNFEIIGEASKFIPDHIKQKYPDIDWKGIVGLRNRIVHEYLELSLDIIWYISEKELPILKNQIKQIK